MAHSYCSVASVPTAFASSPSAWRLCNKAKIIYSFNLGHRHRVIDTPLRRSAVRHQPRAGHIICCASADEKTVYNGRYGPWSVEQEDFIEVWSYRGSLSVAASALVLGTVALLAGDSAPLEGLTANLNAISIVGAAAFGVSLQLIHIYISELKRALQVCTLHTYGAGTSAHACAQTFPEFYDVVGRWI